MAIKRWSPSEIPSRQEKFILGRLKRNGKMFAFLRPVHHRTPLSFGGDNAVGNFVALEPAVHSTYTTWWSQVRNHIAESFTDADWRALVGGARDATWVPPP